MSQTRKLEESRSPKLLPPRQQPPQQPQSQQATGQLPSTSSGSVVGSAGGLQPRSQQQPSYGTGESATVAQPAHAMLAGSSSSGTEPLVNTGGPSGFAGAATGTGTGTTGTGDDPETGAYMRHNILSTDDEFAHVDEVVYGVNVEQRDTYTRNVFIRKVHSIVLAQLALTVGFVCACLYAPAMNQYFKDHGDLMYLALILGLVVVLPGFCFVGLRDTPPWNIVILVLFTILEMFLFGVAAAYYHSEAVLQGVCSVALTTLVFVAFTLQTKRDVHGYLPFVAPIVVSAVVLGFGRWIWPSEALNAALWSAVVSAVVGDLLVYDTLILLHRLTPEQYVSASLSLYLDQPNLMLHLLSTVTRHTRAS